MLLCACTFGNRATFAVDSPSHPEQLLGDLERYFAQLGFQPQEKMDHEYPTRRKQRSYLLGRSQELMGLHRTSTHVVLRLEQDASVLVDWVEISSTKRVPKPADFERTHAKIASDLKARFGIDTTFRFIEAK